MYDFLTYFAPNKRFMKCFVALFVIFCLPVTALAFSGHGKGEKYYYYESGRSIEYTPGVDALGIHVGGEEKVDIDFRECHSDIEELVGRECCLKTLIYTDGTDVKCCNQKGYTVKAGQCQPDDQEHEIISPDDGQSEDLCADYVPTECALECDPATGNAIASSEGDYCTDRTGRCYNGVCEPIVCELNEDLIEGNCIARQDDSGSEPSVESCSVDSDCKDGYYCAEENVCAACVDGEECSRCTENLKKCWSSESNTCTYCAGVCEQDSDCGENQLCDFESNECYCPEGNYLQEGVCTVCPEGTTSLTINAADCVCTSNMGCGEGQFCYFTAVGCVKPETGRCRAIGAYVDADVDGLGLVRKSNSSLSWWGAQGWCEAQGMRLLDVEEFECYQSETSNLVVEKSGYRGGCCLGNNEKCTWGAYEDEKYSNVLAKLREAFGALYLIWTSSAYYSNTLCEKFGIGLSGNSVGNYENDSPAYALCVPVSDGSCQVDSDCESSCQECVAGTCVSICSDNKICHVKNNSCDCPDNYYLSEGMCLVCPDGFTSVGPDATKCQKSCVTNMDCESGDYCNYPIGVCTQTNLGSCVPVGEENIDYTDVQIDGFGLVRVSQTPMIWWSAKSWCEAQGKSLIDVEDLECYKKDSSELVTSNTGYEDTCYAMNSSSKYSHAVVSGLREAVGDTKWLWTASDHYSDYTSDTYCEAFILHLDNGALNGSPCNRSQLYALCR